VYPQLLTQWIHRFKSVFLHRARHESLEGISVLCTARSTKYVQSKASTTVDIVFRLGLLQVESTSCCSVPSQRNIVRNGRWEEYQLCCWSKTWKDCLRNAIPVLESVHQDHIHRISQKRNAMRTKMPRSGYLQFEDSDE